MLEMGEHGEQWEGRDRSNTQLLLDNELMISFQQSSASSFFMNNSDHSSFIDPFFLPNVPHVAFLGFSPSIRGKKHLQWRLQPKGQVCRL